MNFIKGSFNETPLDLPLLSRSETGKPSGIILHCSFTGLEDGSR